MNEGVQQELYHIMNTFISLGVSKMFPERNHTLSLSQPLSNTSPIRLVDGHFRVRLAAL